jgi:hypothetical protein
MNSIRLFLLCSFSSLISAHTWLLSLEPRVKGAVQWREAVQTPCGSDAVNPNPPTYQRGQELEISSGRNNHVSGFVRMSIVPTAESNSQANFDKFSNIVQYHCQETTCNSRVDSDPDYGSDNDAPFNSNLCTQTLTVPHHLPDGDYTLQWVLYGLGHDRGRQFQGHLPYLSCHDFRIRGGPSRNREDQCPIFKGGDVYTRRHNLGSDVCRFHHSDRLRSCVPSGPDDVACKTEPYFTGKPAGYRQCKRLNEPPQLLLSP